MNTESFTQELNARIAKYDLLSHPFYKSWSMGALKKDEIREYACDYYHHVAEFPNYLDTLQKRLPEGELRNVVLENKGDEEGVQSRDGRSHAEIWLDFAQGMGASAEDIVDHEPIEEIEQLIATFKDVVANGSTAEALAALYAYESQVPRVATEKERGLKDHYGADDKTSYYFTLHKSFDVLHARTWLEQIAREVGTDEAVQQAALNAAERAAKSLWNALDGVERERLSIANSGTSVCCH
ncbi:MAG: CADD family putative folate metabolism protein [Cyanobacteria bacterium SZAS LIN-5]|nr:CADD family putative folate metabolism protein [Cyanobacteria bacterium SZAS LIN-5]RTL43170.1 MAG: CADD family putative folate metabolism protein [Candidatus Melainabacteria bacterium]